MSTSMAEREKGPEAPRTRWVLWVFGVVFVLTMIAVPCLLMLVGAVAESVFVVP